MMGCHSNENKSVDHPTHSNKRDRCILSINVIKKLICSWRGGNKINLGMEKIYKVDLIKIKSEDKTWRDLES